MMRHRLLVALVLWVQACVSAPANDGAVASQVTTVRFSGYDLSPSSQVRLQVALNEDGPFAQFATTTTSAQPVTLQDGTKLYPWQVRAAIPRWKPVCGGSEAYVRVLSQGGYSLFTYDGPSDDAPSGVACVLQKLADGEPTLSAMASCASSDSPVLRLTTSSGALPTVDRGDVVVSTQEEADAYACIEQIEGSLSIAESSALSIALPNLRTVTGDLNLSWVRDPAVSPFLPQVRVIDLSGLESVGGALTGHYLGIAADYITFDMGLEALTSVAGAITLELFETSNGDLQGFDSLVHHAGDISVLGGSGDAAWYGLFPNLATVGGDVHVRTGHSTYGVMRALTSIGGDLFIEGSLLQTAGLAGSFPLLQSVGANLAFTGLEVVGPNPVMPALTSVGNALSITGGGVVLTSLTLGSAGGLQIQSLELSDNASLTTWDNTSWQVLGSGPIAIVNNPDLPACAAESFVAAQEALGWTGLATLSGNAACP